MKHNQTIRSCSGWFFVGRNFFLRPTRPAAQTYSINLYLCISIKCYPITRFHGILKQPSFMKGISKYWDSDAIICTAIPENTKEPGKGGTRMRKETNRWVVLVSSMGILLCTGIVYTFSVFAGPLAELRGWAVPDIMMAFAINSAVGPIPMIFGGYFTDRWLGKMDRPHRRRPFRYQLRVHRASDEHFPVISDLRDLRRICAELCLFRLPQQHNPLFPG